MTKRPDLSRRNTTHGLSKLKIREYRSWKDMRARCLNKNDSDYKDYGARGISIHSSWASFLQFYKDMGDRPPDTSLDRINVNGNYEPSNCRWADHETQASNKRNNRLIEYNGKKKTLLQWCRVFGIDHSKVRYRLSKGWCFELCFSQIDMRKCQH